jgi:membrane protein implicated in regulation of membrane protease activity
MRAWLLLLLLFLPGCWWSVRPPELPPNAEQDRIEAEAPKGASQAALATYYRKRASAYEAAAGAAEAEAKRARLEARQVWCWWSGIACLILGAAALALSIAYPVAAFLRIGAVAAGGSGAALLLIGEAVQYLGLLSILAFAAIVVSLVVKHIVLRSAVQSWKATAEALPEKAREVLDVRSQLQQGKLTKAHLDHLLRKI